MVVLWRSVVMHLSINGLITHGDAINKKIKKNVPCTEIYSVIECLYLLSNYN